MMAATFVEARGLSLRYAETTVLEDFDLTVRAGEVCGLVGPNGAGKSTALRCILGVVVPDTGSVSVFGRAIFDLNDPAHDLGLVLDPPGLDHGMTVRRHLRIAAVAGGIDRTRVSVVLLQCGISELARRRIGSLSTGQRQRLAIATALLGKPRLLVLDEPQNGLDAEGIIWLRRLVRAHADAGGAVLLCTHLLTEMELVADRVTVLARRPLFTGTVDELTRGGLDSLEGRYAELTGLHDVLIAER